MTHSATGKFHPPRRRRGNENAPAHVLQPQRIRLDDSPTHSFEAATLPHLRAAYSVARWLLRDAAAAEDAVQEAWLRAFAHFDAWRGGDPRPWLLAIVRNACHDALRARQRRAGEQVFDEQADSPDLDAPMAANDPAVLWEQRTLGAQVDAAIAALPPPWREVIVLRELEEMSYDDIAAVAGIPVGTVMSRLSRGRARLRQALQALQPPVARAGPTRKFDERS